MDRQQGRNRALLIIIVSFVLAVLVTGATLGYFWYRKMADQQAAEATATTSPAKKIETEQIQTALILPSTTDKEGDTIKLSTLTITTPKAWRTVNARNLLNSAPETLYATSSNDILAQFIMVPETEPTDPIHTTNSLSLVNITKWLSTPSMGQGGTVTPAAKATYIQNLANLANGQPADPKACEKGFNLLNISLCGTLLKPTPVATADGKLKGIAYLNTMTQGTTYDPQVIIFMTGKVKDQQLMAYGSFHLLDANSHTLSVNDKDAVKAAWDSLTAGNVPADTLELYQRVVTAVQSISIQAN